MQQATSLLAAGAEVHSKLAGDALELCAGRQASTIVSILAVLGEAYGQVKQVDQMALLSRFTTERFDSAKEALPQWIARKYATAIKLPTMLPPGPAFEASMMNALLSLLPPHFDAVCNELRANLPASWRQAEARLIDFDRTTQQRTEVQGFTYATQATGEAEALRQRAQVLEARLRDRSSGAVKKQWTKKTVDKGATAAQKGYRCYVCKQRGHLKKDCPQRKQAHNGRRTGGKAKAQRS